MRVVPNVVQSPFFLISIAFFSTFPSSEHKQQFYFMGRVRKLSHDKRQIELSIFLYQEFEFRREIMNIYI